ncbi:hypothetical protein QYM36_003336 [Artemia franciscana]|uniref:26S proteasome non-ATPase regulatory subunit 6 n=1 Tax=Artemia franciscana TaxID=6661 RepID=A0AA88I769_ARTSF|nr:hypothetical protein QYM36_003336 [Artemia franciscana]
MTGDFNLPSVFWIDGQGMTRSSPEQNPLIQVLADNFLYQTVTVPTRMRTGQNSSTLDLVITNDPEKVIRTQTLSPIGSSDHMPVLSSIQLNPKPSKYTKQSFTSYKMMVEELIDANLETLISDDTEASWLILRNTLLESQANHTNVTWKKKPKTLLFLTPKIKNLCNRKKKLWDKFVKQKTTVYEKYKMARNLLRKETRKLTVNYEEHLDKNVKENPKLFWKHISLRKPGRHSIPDLENNSSFSSCASEKANLLNQQFASVFSKDDLQSTLPPADQAHTPFPTLYSPITLEEKIFLLLVEIAMSSLNFTCIALYPFAIMAARKYDTVESTLLAIEFTGSLNVVSTRILYTAFMFQRLEPIFCVWTAVADIINMVVRNTALGSLILHKFFKYRLPGFYRSLKFTRIEQEIKHDRYFSPHFRYYVKEMRIIAYNQLLDSYRSLTLDYMARAFDVTTEFIDRELARFIAVGRLHARIDRVGGIVETNRPDTKNWQYQSTIKQGDHLLNRIQKLSRVINI